jgi:hypothetical protein
MGEVYRAVDPALDRKLVLKLLSNEVVFRTGVLELFIRLRTQPPQHRNRL